VKLFFKRPPEMQKVLGKVFQLIIENDKEDLDLKERATYYYKALSSRP
jgi:AP-4 complex subunit beta-1